MRSENIRKENLILLESSCFFSKKRKFEAGDTDYRNRMIDRNGYLSGISW